ncbi:MAG: hypothetical protein ACRD0X_06425 [Thermoanaerobaculia bacterium]
MRRRRLLATGLAAVACWSAATPAAATADEELDYRWSLGGILGTLARIVLPGNGEGRLTTRPVDGGRLAIELVVTSREGAQGDYWRYAALIEPASGRTVSAESAYRYGEKSKERRADLGQEQVIDVASGIHLVRSRRPQSPVNLSIWSDGKIYPVVIEPRGWKSVSLAAGRRRAELFAIRPRSVPGQRPWSGRIDLYIEEGESARPVAIVVDRRWAKVELELVD